MRVNLLDYKLSNNYLGIVPRKRNLKVFYQWYSMKELKIISSEMS